MRSLLGPLCRGEFQISYVSDKRPQDVSDKLFSEPRYLHSEKKNRYCSTPLSSSTLESILDFHLGPIFELIFVAVMNRKPLSWNPSLKFAQGCIIEALFVAVMNR